MCKDEGYQWDYTLIMKYLLIKIFNMYFHSSSPNWTGNDLKGTNSITSIIFMIHRLLWTSRFRTLDSTLAFGKKNSKSELTTGQEPGLSWYSSGWSFRSSDSKMKAKKKTLSSSFSAGIYFSLWGSLCKLIQFPQMGQPVHATLNKGTWWELNTALHLGSNQFSVILP